MQVAVQALVKATKTTHKRGGFSLEWKRATKKEEAMKSLKDEMIKAVQKGVDLF